MAINIKNLEERIQKKAHLVDSNTSVDDLTDMVEAALLLTGSLKTYADSSELPTATGSNEKIGFIQDIKAIKFNNGKEWVTTASGETAAPSGPGVAAATHGRQGISFGYYMGGTSAASNVIEKFSFTVDGNGTDVGDLSVSRWYVSGNSSTANGYTTGGLPFSNVIDNFPFSVDTNASDVGDLTVARYGHGGASSDDHGYSHGGEQPPSGGYNVIDKYTFASNANATDVGDITPGHGLYVNGNNSSTDGYAVGGYQPSAPSGFKNNISKYSFTSDGNTTDAGDMLTAAQGWSSTAVSSTTHGYRHGNGTPTIYNVIEKFEFATDGDATDVGDLTQTRYQTSGASSTTFGYAAGGVGPPSFLHDRIDKWTFASDTNAATVGNLTVSRIFGAGAQV